MTDTIDKTSVYASALTDAEVLDYIASHPDICLQYRKEDGTIEMDGVRIAMTQSRRSEIIENYIDKIKKLNGKTDKRYYIRIKAENRSEGRITLKAQTVEELIDKIYEWVYGCRSKEPMGRCRSGPTLGSLFDEFVTHRRKTTWSDATFKRNLSIWKHYYANDPIINVPIKSLKVKELREWAYGMIARYNLTRKEYLNAATWMKQMLQYALEEELIDKNPYDLLKITNPNVFRQVEEKSDENKVLTPVQEVELYQLCYSYFRTKKFPVHHLLPLAVIMLFQLGVRPCEISTLRYDDIRGDEIVIKRYFSEKAKKVMEDRTKAGHGPRRVILTSLAKEIIQTAREHQRAEGVDDTGYIFMMNDNFNSFYDSMRKAVPEMCEAIGAPRNTAYAGRRTFISSLVDANVNIKTIRNYVGHKDARTTLNNYCYDRSDKETRAAQLEAARLPISMSTDMLKESLRSVPICTQTGQN